MKLGKSISEVIMADNDIFDDSWYYDDTDLSEEEELKEAGFHDDEDQDKVENPFQIWDDCDDFDEYDETEVDLDE